MNKAWDTLSASDKQQLMRIYIKNGIQDIEGMRNHYNTYAQGGQADTEEAQSSTDKNAYIQQVIKWAIDHPGGLWQDNEQAAATRNWMRKNAPAELASLYFQEDDDVRKNIDRRFIPESAQAYEYKQGVTDAIDNAGRNIFNTVDAVTAFMPGPVGTANWLAHMGANALSGKWGNVALDLGMAGAMHGIGKGLKAINETGVVKNIKDKFVNAFIDAFPDSKLALRNNYFNLDDLGSEKLPYKITSLGDNRFKITGFDINTSSNTAKKIGDKTVNVPSNIPEDVAEYLVKKLSIRNLSPTLLHWYRFGRSENFASTIHRMNQGMYEQGKHLSALGYDKETLSHMMSESEKIPLKAFAFDTDTFSSLLERYASFPGTGIKIPAKRMLEYKSFPKIYRDITRKLDTKRFSIQGFDSYPYLKEILRESPQYSRRANSLLEKGLSEEDVVKRLLQDRFTFTRGVGVAEVPEVEAQLFTVPKTEMGGRADIYVFPDLDSVNEDALYTSNSISTAYAYSYPSRSKNSRVGVWYRDPASFDLTGTPLEWWQNPSNRLPQDIVKVAPSTMDDTGWMYLSRLYFGTPKIGKAKNADRVNYILSTIAPDLPQTRINEGMHHFLFRGKRGSELPLPNMKLKIFDTTGKKVEDLPSIFGDFMSEQGVEDFKKGITRQHYGEWTPGFSLGNALGGPLKKGIFSKRNPFAYNVFDVGGPTPEGGGRYE